MDLDKTIDDMIEAGWHVLDTECDDRALAHWKETASAFLIEFLGRRHVVTESFICCWQTKYGVGQLNGPRYISKSLLDETSEAPISV